MLLLPIPLQLDGAGEVKRATKEGSDHGNQAQANNRQSIKVSRFKNFLFYTFFILDLDLYLFVYVFPNFWGALASLRAF